MDRRVFLNLCKFLKNNSVVRRDFSKCACIKIPKFRSSNYRNNETREGPVSVKPTLLYLWLGSICLSLTIFYKTQKKNNITPMKNKFIPVPLKSNVIPFVEATDETIFTGSHRFKYNFIADVVEKTASSVVFIGVFDSWRRDFFTGQPLLKSNGSGFIISPDGLILTNAHVVSQRRQSNLVVKLNDGTTYPAEVEAIDNRTDLATVRIKPVKRLNVMKLGSIDDLRPGEWVIAIGSPLSLANTATCGVVSTVERLAPELGLYDSKMHYIQTDAAITFGNSGGPLVNLNGEAIGINSMKVTTGISFAIPIEYAKHFLKANSSVVTSSEGGSEPELSRNEPQKYTGITVLSLNMDIIRELQLRDKRIPDDVTFGVLVWKVVEGSPAFFGGLQPGDILTHVNEAPIRDANTLYKIIESTYFSTLKVVVVRGGQRLKLSLTPESVW